MLSAPPRRRPARCLLACLLPSFWVWGSLERPPPLRTLLSRGHFHSRRLLLEAFPCWLFTTEAQRKRSLTAGAKKILSGFAAQKLLPPPHPPLLLHRTLPAGQLDMGASSLFVNGILHTHCLRWGSWPGLEGSWAKMSLARYLFLKWYEHSLP